MNETLQEDPAAGELWMLTDGTKDFGLALVVLSLGTHAAAVPVTENLAMANEPYAILPAERTPLARDLLIMANMPNTYPAESFSRRIATVCTGKEAAELVQATANAQVRVEETVFPILSRDKARHIRMVALSKLSFSYAVLSENADRSWLEG